MKESSGPSDVQQAAGFLGDLVTQARLVWRLLRDNRISGWAKLVPFAALIYLLSPIDLFPDIMLPGLSQVDDLAVILLSLKMFVELCPSGIVREHLDRLAGGRRARHETPSPVIDAQYRILDRENE